MKHVRWSGCQTAAKFTTFSSVTFSLDLFHNFNPLVFIKQGTCQGRRIGISSGGASDKNTAFYMLLCEISQQAFLNVVVSTLHLEKSEELQPPQHRLRCPCLLRQTVHSSGSMDKTLNSGAELHT